MCVVDRRDDIGAYAPGANRAHVQAALEKAQVQHGQFESTAVPAQVEVEEESQTSPRGPAKGVPCVVGTPGKDALVKLILERIWGV